MARSRNRDIATILGRTEASNTANKRILQLGEAIDSAQTQNVAMQKFTTLDSLPSTNLTSGDKAWIESSGRLYISNGHGWYNVALVNISPVLTLDQSGTILLDADTLTATVTCTGVDSDAPDPLITFSVESDGNMVGTGTSVSQDSSVFTITALSSDSGGTAGDFTLTFKATDGIGVDNEALSFTLTFSNVVDSSAETIMLIKGIGDSGGTNAIITFLDSDGSAGVGYNENGDPQASTFTPYRSGGYSAYFDGTGDYITTSTSTGFAFGTGDFTWEMWIYHDVYEPAYLLEFGTGGDLGIHHATAQGHLTYYTSTTGISSSLYTTGFGSMSVGQWYHIAAVRDNGTTYLYTDGVLQTSAADTHDYGSSAISCRIGAYGNGGSFPFTGYVRDVRIIKGTAQYTSAFTPPTEPLTAIANTELLAAQLPYFGDGSTNNLDITVNGNAHTEPFGPYNYEPWNDSDHGGSVNFDGSDSLKVDGSPTWPNFGTGAFTVECWVYQPTIAIASLVTVHRQAVASGWYLSIGNTSGNPNWGSYGNGNNSDNTSSGAIVAGAWNHIAMVRTSTSSNGSAWYINGKAAGTFTDTSNYASYTYGPWIGSNDTSGGNQRYFIGNIADVRVSNSAVYSAEFTPPTAPLTATANTVHLMNNKNDAKIYDLAAANTISLTANAETSTTTRKFTTSPSIHMLNGDYMTIDTDTFGGIGTSEPFTIEAWYYIHDITTAGLFHFTDTPGTRNYMLYLNPSSKLIWYDDPNGSNPIATQGTATFTANTWHHVAVTRHTDNLIRIFDDGTLVATSGSAWNYALNRYLEINSYGATYGFRGYMQDIRLTKGVARYTASFTAPTAEFEL